MDTTHTTETSAPLTLLRNVFATRVELTDVRHVRFHVSKKGVLTLWDYDCMLGHVVTRAGARMFEQHALTSAELISFLNANGARQKKTLPA